VLRLRSKAPREIAEWLARGDVGERIYDDAAALDAALRRALERRWGLARAMPPSRETDVFRLVNEEGDGLPGLGLDHYAGFVVANLYGELADSPRRCERALDAIAALGFDGVYAKIRPKHASRLGEAERDRLAPASPLRGKMAPDPLPVVEEGTPYLVHLGDGLATGFYADQRANRRRVCAAAKGKTLLNLFSYTCAFSIAAARAGAARTTNVDAAITALERGRAGFAHASLDPDAHEFVGMDARSFLERAARKNQRWDLVVLDPPSYGTAKGGRFSVSSDFEQLAAAAIRVLSDGGAMLASINHRGTTESRFRRALLEAGRAAGRAIRARSLPPPLDFPSCGESHLKAVWVTA
jgi:23S rRNA (cytosine1962-C5)-methyltransferase